MSNLGNSQRFHIEELVDSVANEFEADSRREIFYDESWGEGEQGELPPPPPQGVTVTDGARRALTEPVLSNWDHIAQELEEGRVTENELRQGLQVVLTLAYELAEERHPRSYGFGREELGLIDVHTTREVIETRCPYLFWC